MARGAVYFHPQFRFHDNEIGEKRFVVLNDPVADEPYLVAKTTTNLRDKTYPQGCDHHRKVFFISGRAGTPFPLDTLIQLYEIYEFSKTELLVANLRDRVLEHKGDLTPIECAQLVNCIKKLKNDIPQVYFAMITRR